MVFPHRISNPFRIVGPGASDGFATHRRAEHTRQRWTHPSRHTHTHTSGCASFLHPARVFSLDAPNAVRRARARGSESSGTVGRGDRPGRGRSPRDPADLDPPPRAFSRLDPTLARDLASAAPAPARAPSPARSPRSASTSARYPSTPGVPLFPTPLIIPGRSPSPSRAIRFDPILR